MAQQVFEQRELARLKRDRSPAAPDRACQDIHLKVALAQQGLDRRPTATAQQRLDAGQQLGEREGLHQIVVAAAPEARDPVLDSAQGAEKQNRRVLAGAAQHLDHRQTVELRQHAVVDRHVVVLADGL